MILGLDVSTSITGFCLLTNNGKFVRCYSVDLRKEKSFCQKVELINLFLPNEDVTHIFIEDKLSSFSAGKTMQQTLLKLASFNGAVSWLVFDKMGVTPVHIHPSTIKATMKLDNLFIPKGVKGKDKKKFTARFVRDLFEEFQYEETKAGNLKPGVDDRADAYCVARVGYLKFLCDEGKK